MNRRLGICLLGLVAVTVGLSAVAAGATTVETTAADRSESAARQPLTTPEDFDSTLFQIRLYENRSARWSIQHSRPLRNETQVEQFEAFATEFRTNDTTTYTNFRDRARSLVAFGRDVTDREMAAAGFDRDASVTELGQTRGVLELSFVWRNFSRLEGNRVLVGDVFEGGMFVDQGQRLEFRRGPALAFTGASPDPDSMARQGDLAASDSVTWIGEQQFADERPTAELAPRNSLGGTDGDGGGTDSAGDDGASDPEGGDAGGLPAMAIAGALLVVVAASGAAWYRGYLPPDRSKTAGPEATDAEEPADATSPTEPASGVSGGAATAQQVTEAELLSDEDQVLTLLEENDGRMKQVAIVEETDWSKSKVSMLLSDMEEEDQISKLRLGRENIISLAGEEPDAAGSPFEDE